MADFKSGLQWADTAVFVEFDKFLSDTETRQNHEQCFALHFITFQPNDTYKLQWSLSPIRQPTL